MSRYGCWRRSGILSALLAVITGITCQAQFETASVSTNDRDRQFEELARDTAALEQQGMLLRKLIKLATPSVAHIDSQRVSEDGYSTRKGGEEAGSGVIVEIDSKSYVLTNRHVIDDTSLSHIKIKLEDGRILHPTNKWEDRETDIAVLAISAKNLIPARIGDSNQLDIGDFVVAVGSPFGLSHSVTFGIISAKGRRDLELGDGSIEGGIRYQDFLQTDAAINPGNSGGPLLNLHGEFVGINTAIASSSGGSEGIGFTIPSNMAMTVARQFIKYGRVVRAYLGVNLRKRDEFNQELAASLGLSRPQGACIRTIQPNTPAARSGLQENDVVLEFNGRRVEDDDHLINLVGFTEVDKEVDVLIFRQGKSLPLKVKVADRVSYPNQ